MVGPVDAREVGHFERGGAHYDSTVAEQALEREMLPLVVLTSILGPDDTFRQIAAGVAGSDERAHWEARVYARAGSQREAVAAMLLLASTTPPALITTRLMNMNPRRAVFVDGPREPTDSRNALRVGTLETLLRGARVVAARPRRMCVECGDDSYRGVHCVTHLWMEQADREAARVILSAAAEQLGFQARKGPKARRAIRSAQPT